MAFDFFKLLPAATLEGIDEIIRAQVMPFVKKFGVLPRALQIEAQEAAERLHPEAYFENLVEAWNIHNQLAFEIDRFLVDVYSDSGHLNDSRSLDRGLKLLGDAFKAEHIKRVYSAGVKLALERSIKILDVRYRLTNEEWAVVLTPWKPSFWIEYLGEHTRYIYYRRTGEDDAESSEELICKRFHAGERVILRARLLRKFDSLWTAPIEQLLDRMRLYDNSLISSQELFVKGIYLTLERRDLRAIQNIVRYDNREEYFFGSNLFGVPDLFLRMKVIEFLHDAGMIEMRPSVLMYEEVELLSLLEKAIKRYD